MANATAVVVPSFNEKARILKPLPVPKTISSLDDSSRLYVSKLLTHWLIDLDIPMKPWCEVLLQIFLTMYEKAALAISTEENRTIWVQTFINNAPMESKFLPNVFHGKELSNGKIRQQIFDLFI